MASENVYAVRQTIAHLAISGIKLVADVYVLRQTIAHLGSKSMQMYSTVY